MRSSTRLLLWSAAAYTAAMVALASTVGRPARPVEPTGDSLSVPSVCDSLEQVIDSLEVELFRRTPGHITFPQDTAKAQL